MPGSSGLAFWMGQKPAACQTSFVLYIVVRSSWFTPWKSDLYFGDHTSDRKQLSKFTSWEAIWTSSDLIRLCPRLFSKVLKIHSYCMLFHMIHPSSSKYYNSNEAVSEDEQNCYFTFICSNCTNCAEIIISRGFFCTELVVVVVLNTVTRLMRAGNTSH